MRKLIFLLILLILGGVAAYYSGVYSEIPVDRIIRRGPQAGAGQEYNARGISELNAGNSGGAVTALREAIRLEPDNSIIARNLSIALAREANSTEGDEQKAIGLLTESLQIWPKNPEGLDGLSTLHFRASRYTEALEPALVLQEMMPDRADLGEYVSHLKQKVASEKGMSAETGDHFRLLYSHERRLEYEGEIVSILQTQLDSLTAALGIFPVRTIDVLLLTDELGSRADPFDPFLEGIYDGQIRLYLGAGIGDREKLVITVRHEMVHALLHQAAGNLPGWVQEGLAQKAGEEPDYDQIMTARKYVASRIRGGFRVDLTTMGTSFVNMEKDSRANAYALSLLFMDYLTREYGSGFIPRFVAELASDVKPQDAVKAVTGRDFAQLQDSFSAELETVY